MGISDEPQEVVAFADHYSAASSGAPYYFHRKLGGCALYLHTILKSDLPHQTS